MANPPQITLELNPQVVGAACMRAATASFQVVATCVSSFDGVELAEPEPQAGDGMARYQFAAPPMSSDERRATYQNWLFSKGFQDLIRGIRHSLEQAYVFIAVVTHLPKPINLRQFNDFKKTAGRLNFPDLLTRVNAGLSQPLRFGEEYLSMQKARNCLEHRGGIVGTGDVDATGVLQLIIPKMKLFYMHGQEEVELAPGHVVDDGTGQDVQILMKFVPRTTVYQLGQPLQMTPADFYETAMACHVFASQLIAALPKPDLLNGEAAPAHN